MALIAYTSYADIRAALGISDKEIPDTTFASVIYITQLQEHLRELNDTMDAAYIALVAPLSASQTRFSNLMQTYCSYYVALQCVTSLPMFSFKAIKDQHADLERVDDPYKTLREDLSTSLSWLKGKLLAAYAVVNPAEPAPDVVTRVNVVTTGLALDPITGV